jgi:hypothetical protein
VGAVMIADRNLISVLIGLLRLVLYKKNSLFHRTKEEDATLLVEVQYTKENSVMKITRFLFDRLIFAVEI